MEPRERLIVALDQSTRGDILQMADRLHGFVGMYKIGLQAFVATGPSIVRELLARGERIFLDLKLHDIPNTVTHAVDEAAALGASLLTIHAAGGPAMMRAASGAAGEEGKLSLLAVTVLTSLGDEDLSQLGVGGSLEEQVVRLGRLAHDCGIDGVVASPREIRLLRETLGQDFLIVTPGIRAAGEDAGDQRRTMSAAEAVAAGADYIVVGRPITEAAQPREAAMRIVDSITR
jgi:orotidine-5'-phosphate decarboxylase